MKTKPGTECSSSSSDLACISITVPLLYVWPPSGIVSFPFSRGVDGLLSVGLGLAFIFTFKHTITFTFTHLPNLNHFARKESNRINYINILGNIYRVISNTKRFWIKNKFFYDTFVIEYCFPDMNICMCPLSHPMYHTPFNTPLYYDIFSEYLSILMRITKQNMENWVIATELRRKNRQ